MEKLRKMVKPERHEGLPELFTQTTWRSLSQQLGLPRRQTEVARLVCLGLSNRQIAGELGLSVPTIGMHLRLLYEKLGANTRVGLVVQLVHKERLLRSQKSIR